MAQARQYGLDYAKILATLGVIAIHTTVFLGSVQLGADADVRVASIYGTLARFAVPLFFMVSGALFLGRTDINYKTIWRKYILRLTIVWISWMIIYAIFTMCITGIDGGIRATISHFLYEATHFMTNNQAIHLWFLPAMMFAYALLPIGWAIAHDPKILRYCVVLILSGSTLVMIGRLVAPITSIGADINALISTIPISTIFTPFSLMLVGYYLYSTPFLRDQRIIIYILGVLGAIVSVVMTGEGELAGMFVDYYLPPMLIFTVALLVATKQLPSPRNKLAERILKSLSACLLGIYLIHQIVLYYMLVNFPLKYVERPLSIVVFPGLILAAFIISWAIVWFIRVLPAPRKLVD